MDEPQRNLLQRGAVGALVPFAVMGCTQQGSSSAEEQLAAVCPVVDIVDDTFAQQMGERAGDSFTLTLFDSLAEQYETLLPLLEDDELSTAVGRAAADMRELSEITRSDELSVEAIQELPSFGRDSGSDDPADGLGFLRKQCIEMRGTSTG